MPDKNIGEVQSAGNANVPPKQDDELRMDAEIRLTIKESELEALVIVYPPKNGGEHITAEALKKIVEANKITYGIDYDMIENIAKERLYDTIFTIAHGEPSEDGTDGYVTAKFDKARKLQPKMLSDGTVDYRDLGVVVNICTGDTIATITPETQGHDGKNIFGKVLPAIPGKPPVVPQGNNTGINGDGTLLLALASGNLVYENNKFSVNTVFTVNTDVDISIGNIVFMGDVVVKGNVEEGFEIHSQSTITVMGMVNGALLEAEQGITVKNGVVNSTLISKRGSIQIGFGENSTIKCKENCKGTSFVSCKAEIEGDFECTGKPGAIVGGSYRVMGSISCNTIGHRNYIATNIAVGNYATLTEESQKLKKSIAEIEEELKKINISLTYLKKEKEKLGKLDKNKEDFITNAVRMKVQKMLDKKPLEKRINEINAIVGNSESLIIKVQQNMFPNVKISMGSFTLQNKNEYSRCMIRTGKDGIEILNM